MTTILKIVETYNINLLSWTTPKKIAYNFRDCSERICYEDLSDCGIDLHVSFDMQDKMIINW
jgi:hypothetical protein